VSAEPPRPWPAFEIPDPLPDDGTVLHEDGGWRWVVRAGTIEQELEPGGKVDVENRIVTQLREAVAQLEQTNQAWPDLTDNQRDQVLRQLVRIVARLCRFVARELDDVGPSP
jgi:hypothetical protein